MCLVSKSVQQTITPKVIERFSLTSVTRDRFNRLGFSLKECRWLVNFDLSIYPTDGKKTVEALTSLKLLPQLRSLELTCIEQIEIVEYLISEILIVPVSLRRLSLIGFSVPTVIDIIIKIAKTVPGLECVIVSNPEEFVIADAGNDVRGTSVFHP